jgi:hypothetical protein
LRSEVHNQKRPKGHLAEAAHPSEHGLLAACTADAAMAEHDRESLTLGAGQCGIDILNFRATGSRC